MEGIYRQEYVGPSPECFGWWLGLDLFWNQMVSWVWESDDIMIEEKERIVRLHSEGIPVQSTYPGTLSLWKGEGHEC